MLLLFSLFVTGPWSDVVGRRALLLSGSIGNLCAYLGLLFFHRFQLPFFFIVLTYLLQGFSGGQAAVIGTGFAFISDVSTKEEVGIHRSEALLVGYQ